MLDVFFFPPTTRVKANFYFHSSYCHSRLNIKEECENIFFVLFFFSVIKFAGEKEKLNRKI